MKRVTKAAIPIALITLLAACSGSDAGTDSTVAEAPAEADITIADFAFSGASSVNVGDTVTVTNEDTLAHTWTEVDGGFDSGNLAQGESFEFTFDEAGEYEFICSIHPEMEGTITVEG